MVLANSIALKLAGITGPDTRSRGWSHRRDRQGNPTGALKDAAMDLLFKVVPPLTHDQRRHAIERALAHAASVGVTSVQHMNPDYPDIAVYSELLDEGKLTTRIYAAPLITGVDDQVKNRCPACIRRTLSAHRRRQGLCRRFARSSTAYFFEPFGSLPDNHGLLSDECIPSHSCTIA